jgi:dihydrofolate reductase
MMTTIDGYFEGPNHDLSWHNVDQEFVTFAEQQLDETDLLLFGERTYQLMATFWPSEEAKTEDPGTAERMSNKNKIVFSTTLEKATWEHTELKRSVDTIEINALKAEEGKDIFILGSSNLCLSFLKQQLLDEIRIMVNPLALGEGTILFDGLHEKIPLQMTSSRTFANGNILLTYQVVK